MSAITIFDIPRYAPLLGATVVLGVLSAPVDRPAQACGVPDEPTTTMPTAPEIPPVQRSRTIDLAICLDTSGSMSGLINSARLKLWDIVNDLALACPKPQLRVALLTFGNDGHDQENGWVRVDSGLTEDLDLISQRLFALSTNGGTEYVGRALQYAGQLDWNPSDDALKLIVVAGNESADQDRQAPFQAMCRSLITRGIMVDSIYCGSPGDAVAAGWMEVARLADGQFASIDQDGTQLVQTPFDDQLAELSSALNETYVPLGARGAAGKSNQSAQDANAQGLSTVAAATRAVTKARGLYNCSWDLVDACRSGQVKLDQVKTDELPVNMQSMTVAQRTEYVNEMGLRRLGIQERVKQLGIERDAWVAAELKRLAVDESRSLDWAIRNAMRDRIRSRGYIFTDEMPGDGC